MEERNSDIDKRLAARLRALRVVRGLTLEDFAEASGVSRSMISLIERGESSPTANVLDRLAAGLGVTLASLFAEEAQADASPVSRRSDQQSWRDPATGYLRRNLSPAGHPSPIELVEVTLPPGAHASFDTGFRSTRLDQQIFMLDGAIEVTIGDDIHRIAKGDCLAMHVDRPTAFRNGGKQAARYLLALSISAPARLKGRR